MTDFNANDLFFVCSLIEFMGRRRKLRRGDVVVRLGREVVRSIYEHAGVWHCLPIEEAEAEIAEHWQVPTGDYDNVTACRYTVPSYWDIGKVYAWLIEDVRGARDVIDTLMDVYASPVSGYIQNFNSDFYYQPRAFIALAYTDLDAARAAG